jgi:hypothetical protein
VLRCNKKVPQEASSERMQEWHYGTIPRSVWYKEQGHHGVCGKKNNKEPATADSEKADECEEPPRSNNCHSGV